MARNMSPEDLLAHARWKASSGDPKGWRVTRQFFGVAPLEELTGRGGKVIYFRSYETANKRAEQMNSRLSDVQTGIRFLQAARAAFKRAGATQTLKRVRLALTSAGGAERHARGLQTRAG